MNDSYQAQLREASRRENGEFGPRQLAEEGAITSLNDVTMPGLASDQTAEWIRLDQKVAAAGYAKDALVGAELARYEFYSDLVDAAVARGERDWMPTCPVHSRGGDGIGPDGWGQDLSCPVCLTPDGRPASVNRLGISEAVQQKWARDAFDAHSTSFADAADFFANRTASDPSQYTYIDVEVS